MRIRILDLLGFKITYLIYYKCNRQTTIVRYYATTKSCLNLIEIMKEKEGIYNYYYKVIPY